MMINDKLCQLMAEVVTSPPTIAKATREVHEHFLAIGREWSASQDIPDTLRAALLRPDGLSFSGLDRAAVRLRPFVREMPALQFRLASLSLLLTRLGGAESRLLAGHYFAAALYPPASIDLQRDPPAGSTFESGEVRLEGSEGLTILCGGDGKIDERVIIACQLARSTYDACWSSENALLDMAQDDTHFVFECERADALQRDWRALFDGICAMWALTPAGRFAKARLAEYLTNTEPVGPAQDDGLQRLIASMGRDLDRAKQHGWLPPGP